MKITGYILTQTSATPYYYLSTEIELENDDLDTNDESDSPLYVTNVDGEWYLEYDYPEETIRVLGVDDRLFSRDLEKLLEELKNLDDETPKERTIEQTGVKLELQHLDRPHRVVLYVNKELLESEVVFNAYDNSYCLLRYDTYDHYRIITVDGKEPQWDPSSLPREHFSTHFGVLSNNRHKTIPHRTRVGRGWYEF